MPRTIVMPDAVKLDLTQGDWLLVKRRLNAGERRRVYARMVQSMEPGSTKLDPMQVAISKAVEYLLDWGTFSDAAGKPIVIRDKPPAVVESALNSLAPEDFAEIVSAIEAHEAAQDAEREREKNAQGGESGSSAPSPSVAS